MIDDVEELARRAVDYGFQIHKQLGPGLLESAYEAVLAASLTASGLTVERQKIVPIRFNDLVIADAFRADIIVNHRLIIEIKSAAANAPVFTKQLLTYLRLMDQPVGLLMKFGFETFRDGIKRVVNGPSHFTRTRS